MRCSWCGRKITKDEKWVKVGWSNFLHIDLTPGMPNPAILHRDTCLKAYERKVLNRMRYGGKETHV